MSGATDIGAESMAEGAAAQTNTVAYIVQIAIGALIVLYWVLFRSARQSTSK